MNTDAITIEYGSGTLTAEDFVDDGFILEENLCSASQIAFGACEAAAVEVRIASTAASFVGKTLTVKLGANALGKYKVVSDERAYDGETRILKAYDALYDVNGQDVSAWYESIDWNVVTTLKQFRDSFFRHIGITQATADLVNDEMPVKKTMEASSCSGATILQAICEVNGVFGHINANGHFQYVSLSNGEPTVVNADEVLDSLTEDFTVPAFDGVLIRTEEGDIGGQYPASGAQNQYIITGNFLCYGKTTAELQSIAQNALSKIGGKTYVPFEADLECQGNIALGGKVTIPTEPATFTSYVLQRKLVGFEDLEEYFVAQGSPEYVPDVNSARNQMVATSQRINKLTSTVEGTESRVAEIEKDYAKESVIKQLPHEILLQASETSEGGTPQKATITLTVKDGKGSTVSTEAVDILFNGLVTFTNNAKQAAIGAAATDATNKTKAITDNIYYENKTTIDGGKIETNSIKAISIDTTDLVAQKVLTEAYDSNFKKRSVTINNGKVTASSEATGFSAILDNGYLYIKNSQSNDAAVFSNREVVITSPNGNNQAIFASDDQNSMLALTGTGYVIIPSISEFYLGNAATLKSQKIQIGNAANTNIYLKGAVTINNKTPVTGVKVNATTTLTGETIDLASYIPTSLPANGGTSTNTKFLVDNIKGAGVAELPYYAYNEIGDSSTANETYFKNLLKKLVTEKRTDLNYRMLVGRVRPNSLGRCTLFVYEFSDYNNTGMPQYASGTYWAAGGVRYNFGTDNGVWYFKQCDDDNTWRPLGTGATDACAGNDSRLSNSRPASDVYSWAKASTPPSYLPKKTDYSFTTSNLPTTFDSGLTVGFVSATSGYGSYGTVMNIRTYDGGGGSLQLYAPYSPTYGGTRLKARFGDYDHSTGNSWTALKEIAWVSDIPTNTNQLTNGAGFITGITKAMVTTALGYTPPTSDTGGTSLTISGNVLSLVRGTSVLSTVNIPTSGGSGNTAHFHTWSKITNSQIKNGGSLAITYGQYSSLNIVCSYNGGWRTNMLICKAELDDIAKGAEMGYDICYLGNNYLQLKLAKSSDGSTITVKYAGASDTAKAYVEVIYAQGQIIS